MAVLKLSKAFCDCQPQTASFRISRLITALKAFHDVARVKIKLGGRNILNRNKNILPSLFNIDIDAGMLKGILSGIDKQIFQYAEGFLRIERKNELFLTEGIAYGKVMLR